ncbi:hypothetical protein [Caulobacter mirabilis]|uniref:Lipoprotein n=1 Tax=Caulobacter mirabilis TaxID=69666 RepID=A0A2D2ASR9_9CAUL|nr:hypothetical protein [Caulobacter mirabilis]ATQ41023.1 hypothetical protein CSW64_00680 [Caulobacter mirabilis]
MKSLTLWARALAAGFAAAALAGAAHAATYIDTGLSTLKPEDRAVVANPQPVQLLFTFKTAGAANARATKELTKKVTEVVTASGAFSEVSEAPVANGAILSVTIDNLIQEGATGKGFVTGLTFGLKGTMVSDVYVCTVEYVTGADGAKIAKSGRHALHTTIGVTQAPPNGVKAKNIVEAVMTMTDQLVSNTLNDVAKDPAFTGVTVDAATAPAPATPTPTPAPAPAAEPTPSGAEAG